MFAGHDKWDWRALVSFLVFVVAAVIVVGQITSLQHQLNITNRHLTKIQQQECLDANQALRQYIAQINPDPAPVLRTC